MSFCASSFVSCRIGPQPMLPHIIIMCLWPSGMPKAAPAAARSEQR